MKRRLLFFVLGGSLLAACSTTSKLNFATKLYQEKNYAEAVNVLHSMENPTPEAYLLLAKTEFQLSHMQRAAQALEFVPKEMLSSEDLKMMQEAQYQSKGKVTDTTLVQLELTLYPFQSNEFADEYAPFYCNNQLHYVATESGDFTNAAISPVTGKTYTEIKSTSNKVTLMNRLNTPANDGPVAVGKYAVVFNRSVPASRNKKENVALFEVKSKEVRRKNIQKIKFCKDSFNYLHPYFQNENTLVFATNFVALNANKSKQYDLYFSTKNMTDAFADWETPKSFGENLNSPYDELFPTFLNEKTIVFSSNRPGGYGGLDLYIATADSVGNWSTPKLLPSPINSVRDDFYLVNLLNEVTRYLVCSNRNGSDDIFEFQVFMPIQWKTFWESEMMEVPNRKQP